MIPTGEAGISPKRGTGTVAPCAAPVSPPPVTPPPGTPWPRSTPGPEAAARGRALPGAVKRPGPSMAAARLLSLCPPGLVMSQEGPPGPGTAPGGGHPSLTLSSLSAWLSVRHRPVSLPPWPSPRASRSGSRREVLVGAGGRGRPAASHVPLPLPCTSLSSRCFQAFPLGALGSLNFPF